MAMAPVCQALPEGRVDAAHGRRTIGDKRPAWAIREPDMKSSLYALLPALLLTSGIAVANAPLNKVETALAAHIKSEHPRALALLKESVDINSGTMNFAGVRRVGTVFEREFRELGFKVQWLDGSAYKRAGHLVASRGKKGPKILLIGHLDTVFAEDSPFQDRRAHV